MAYTTILFERADGIARITLNRPEAANSMNLDMVRDLHHAAGVCDQDPGVRAVLITGAGKLFSAGGDLKYLIDAGEEIGDRLMQMTASFHGAVSTFARMDAPVVMAVNGAAGGGGFSLAISGDIVLAAESAKFTLAYTAAGLSPDGGSTYFLPRQIGLRRARELMLTNRVVSAADAGACGIVDRVLPDAELMAEAEAQAAAFAAGPTSAYGTVKRLLDSTYFAGLETQMQLESRTIAAQAQTDDAQEGMTAFAEKRKPVFKGR